MKQRFKLRASDFLVYGSRKGRLAPEATIIGRHSAEPTVREIRNVLRHAVASARLESVYIDDGLRYEIVKEAMEPLRARHGDRRDGRRAT
jgi:hypothetical protein